MVSPYLQTAVSKGDDVCLFDLDVCLGFGLARDDRLTSRKVLLQDSRPSDMIGMHVSVHTIDERQPELFDHSGVPIGLGIYWVDDL